MAPQTKKCKCVQNYVFRPGEIEGDDTPDERQGQVYHYQESCLKGT